MKSRDFCYFIYTSNQKINCLYTRWSFNFTSHFPLWLLSVWLVPRLAFSLGVWNVRYVIPNFSKVHFEVPWTTMSRHNVDFWIFTVFCVDFQPKLSHFWLIVAYQGQKRCPVVLKMYQKIQFFFENVPNFPKIHFEVSWTTMGRHNVDFATFYRFLRWFSSKM